MRLFINETCIRISDTGKSDSFAGYKTVLKLPTVPDELSGKCLLENSGTKDLEQIFRWLAQNRLPSLQEIVLFSDKVSDLKNHVKNEFKVVKAAGGLVRKEDKFLLIYRLGKWDLPKGKLEKDEKMKEAALREVEEECGIKAIRREKICNTWHSYHLDGKKILKKTAWYSMDCRDDQKMRPQKEEDIEEIRWMSRNEARQALQNSYLSIRAVFDCYQEMQKNSNPSAPAQSL